MAGFLSMVKAVAVPAATIAAKLLPEVLALLPVAEAAANPQLVKTGMVDWVPDSRSKKIYAANSTSAPIVLSFAQQTPGAAGAYDIETFATQLAPRNAFDATAALRAYGGGAVANNYLHPAQAAGSAAASGEVLAQIVKYMPLLAAAAFVLFGGGIRIARGTRDGVDFWEITSTSLLRYIAFSYRTAAGNNFQFRTQLSNPTGGGTEHHYSIPMNGPNESTGVLNDVSITIDGDTPAMQALLTQVEQIPFDRLPDQVRARLGA